MRSVRVVRIIRMWNKKQKAKSEERSREPAAISIDPVPVKGAEKDSRKRLFLRGAALLIVGGFAAAVLPKRAEALVMGSTPGTSVLGLKNSSNSRINPATEESVAALLLGNSVLKKTTVISSSGTVHTPSSGKKIRLYTSKFSLDATMTSISFRFTAGGTDFEKYLAPRTGGLYGTNNHPNYVEGGVNEVLYCAISGTGNVQINIDYLEV